jgi:hypothetical protein
MSCLHSMDPNHPEGIQEDTTQSRNAATIGKSKQYNNKNSTKITHTYDTKTNNITDENIDNVNNTHEQMNNIQLNS